MHEKSGIWVNSRIQKYQEYIPLLETYEKKPNSLRSDSAFFSYNAKIYTQVLLQILSGDPEPDILSLIYTQQHSQKKLPCTKGFILLILVNHSAGREGFEMFTCSGTPRGPAVADHEENDNKLSNIVYRFLKYSIRYIYGNSI